MCEKFYWLSPYLYCANNPVNAVDPDGMIWDDVDEINRLISNISNRIQNLQIYFTEYKVLFDNKNIAVNEKDVSEALLKETDQKITLLQNCLHTIKRMNEDQKHVYKIVPIDKNQPHYIEQGDDGIINIQASSDSMAVHEIRPMGQNGHFLLGKTPILTHRSFFMPLSSKISTCET